MTKLTFARAYFVKSAVHTDHYPTLKDPRGRLLPEIAVAGRSNVGKSSLLNHLFASKGLAKTSSTPGKTQLLNFFCLDDSLVFTDLPGYGYAKVPVKVREEWGPMVQSYLDTRPSLELILFLFDIRRLPNEEDVQFIEWVAAADKKLVLVLTKVDKVSSGERASNIRKILHAFPTGAIAATVAYSSTKNVGRRELIAVIQQALDHNARGQ